MILGHKISNLKWDDYLILFIFFILIILPEYFPNYYIEFLVPWIIGWATINSPLGIKFSNFFFSIAWLILCWIFYLKNSTFFPLLPILGYINYQIIRGIYWLNYKREFIPVFFHNSGFELRYSKSENRRADKHDGYFSLINFTTGLIIFVIYLLWLKDNELI